MADDEIFPTPAQEAEEDNFLVSQVISHLSSIGYGERVIRSVGNGHVLYQGFFVKLVPGERDYKLVVEKGPNGSGEQLGRVREQLVKILEKIEIEEKDKPIVLDRELREGPEGSLTLTLRLSKMNDKEKRVHAFIRQGFKPLMRAVYFSDESRQ